MAWPVAFALFVSLALFSNGYASAGAISLLLAAACFGYGVRQYGRPFLPVLLLGVLLAVLLFLLRYDYWKAKSIATDGTAIASHISRRSVVLTLSNRLRLRLTGIRPEERPLKGAMVEFSCRTYPQPEIAQSPWERLSGIQLWCEKTQLRVVGYTPLAHWRQRVLQLLEQRFATLGETSLIAAFLLGDTDSMPPETLAAFRDMGLMHLFAVSGLNVALLFALLYLPLRLVRLPFLGAILGYTVTTAFLLLLDFPVPLFRAWLFLTIAGLAKLLDRRLSPWPLLFFTALVVETLIPLSTFSISFILSFTVTAAILFFYEPLYFCFAGKNWLRNLVAGHVALTLAAGLVAHILSYAIFKTAQPLALFYNLLLVPFSGLYLFCAVLFIFFEPARFALQPLDTLYLAFAGWHSQYPMGFLPVPEPGWLWFSVFWAALALMAVLYFQWRRRLWTLRRALYWLLPLYFCIFLLPWFVAKPVRVALYAVPNKIWFLENGRFTIAGSEKFSTTAPTLCLPITGAVHRTATNEKDGIIFIDSHCFAFAASLRPEKWPANFLAHCARLDLFQAKNKTTTAAEWQELFALFGFSGELKVRRYFQWYSDRPLRCSKSEDL